MLIGFEAKRVLVTGAAHGIGAAIAEGFAERGAAVVATDILVGKLAALPPAIERRALDVTDAQAVAALREEAPFDVLVHVAGGVVGQAPKPVEEVSEAEWDAIQDVNVKGAFLAARAVIPGMKARGAGRIVIISSGAGLGVSLTGIQSYATAKTAQLGLVRQLAHELGPHGITVNAVAPGFVRSNPDTERQWERYGEAGQRALVERIAMRRLGEPWDIAAAVLFLASPHASYITGQVLPVTGRPLG
jgi:3-oxoacyl-[acyl-carrier protein] reductase